MLLFILFRRFSWLRSYVITPLEFIFVSELKFDMHIRDRIAAKYNDLNKITPAKWSSDESCFSWERWGESMKAFHPVFIQVLTAYHQSLFHCDSSTSLAVINSLHNLYTSC